MTARLARAFARGIRAERSRLGLTQDQLAGLLGWSQSKLSEIELGRRVLPAEDLADLCTALHITLNQLLSAADPEDRDALGL